MTKVVRAVVSALDEKRIKTKDGIDYIECPSEGVQFKNDSDKKAFLSHVKAAGYSSYEVVPIMARYSESKIHHYEVRLLK